MKPAAKSTFLWISFLIGAAPACVGAQQSQPASSNAEPREIARLVEQARQSLDEGKADASALLSDPAFSPARPWPRFRELIRKHAPSTPITIVTPVESGTRMKVRMRLVEPDGSPAVGALVYFYHTDQGGEYGPNPANVEFGSDNQSARLFGYAKSDADGAIEIHTIRPGGYPGTTIPEHIHFRIWTSDKRELGGEILFKDDPRLQPDTAEEMPRDFRIVVCDVSKAQDGTATVEAEIRLD